MNPITLGYEIVRTITPDTPVGFTGFIPGSAGNVTIEDRRGVQTTFPVLAGVLYPIYVARLVSATTTATGIVGVA